MFGWFHSTVKTQIHPEPPSSPASLSKLGTENAKHSSMKEFLKRKVRGLVAQSCPTLCNPMDYNPPGSSVHGILQAGILEWVAIPFSRRFFLIWGLNPGILHCRQILYCLSRKVVKHAF